MSPRAHTTRRHASMASHLTEALTDEQSRDGDAIAPRSRAKQGTAVHLMRRLQRTTADRKLSFSPASCSGRALRSGLTTEAWLTRLRHSHSLSLVVAAAGGIGSLLISVMVTSTHDSRADSADASCCASDLADRTKLCVCFGQIGVTLPLPQSASPSVPAGSAACDWESADNVGADEAAPSLPCAAGSPFKLGRAGSWCLREAAALHRRSGAHQSAHSMHGLTKLRLNRPSH